MKTNQYLSLMALFLCGCVDVIHAEEPDSIVRDLPDFVIKAEQFRRTPDGLEVVPNKRQLGHSSSGYELVRNLMIPGVNVNIMKNEINALGGEVSIFIDGLPADIREVRQLRPADVLKVQYMESPSGKFAGNNTVINFILKKRDSGGYIALEASALRYSGMEAEIPAIESDKASSSRSFKYSFGLSGSFNLPRDQFIEASASATATRNHYGYRYKESGEDILSSTLEDYYNFTADVTYVKKFSRGNQLVLKLSEFYNVSSADYYGNNESWQHLWSSETLFFGEYMHPLWGIATLRVAPGVSTQFYRLHGNELVCYVAPRAQTVFTIQPAQKQFVQLLALYGNSFPQLSMMSTATQQVNLWHIKRGNPYLKQTGMMRFMAVYGIGIRNVNLQATAIYNGAYRLPIASYSFESGKLLESWLPDGKWDQLNASLSVTWLPSSSFNLQATGGWLYNHYSRVADVSAGCWKGNMEAAYYIGDFSISARVETPVKMAGYDRNIVKSPWKYGMSVSWSHKAFRAEAGTNNPFSKHPVYKYTLDSPEYRYSGTTFTPVDRASAYVKLSWSLDFGKKTSRDKLSVDRSISTGVIRAE